MPDLEHLETLLELFPKYPRLDLAARLLCAPSLESVVDELFAESTNTGNVANSAQNTENYLNQPHVPEYSVNAHRLKDLLPQRLMDELADALEKHNDDFDTTLEALMGPDSTQQLGQLTGLSELAVYLLLETFNDDVLVAAAHVVANHKHTKSTRASRVQGRNSAAIAHVDAYKYQPHSSEAIDLRECIWAEQELQQINYDFFVKLLVFFQGDVARVLDLATMYIEAGRQSVTFDESLGFEHRKMPKPASASRPASAQEALYSAVVRRSPRVCLLQTRQSQVKLPAWHAETRKTSPKDTEPVVGRLDLHGYLVSEAKQLAALAAALWWAEELECRHQEGRLHKYGTRAEFVEQLHIITGRGIHSADGQPRIRTAVLQFLRKEDYLFQERVGSVVLIGKKLKG